MAAGDLLGATLEVCPECGATNPVDPQWVRWCDQCDWNIDAGLEPPPTGRWARRRRRALNATATSTYRSVLEGSDPGSARWPRALATGLGSLVLLGLVLFAVLDGWLFADTTNALHYPAALVCLAVLWCLRPRPGRLRRGTRGLTREQAPNLWALVDRSADALSQAPPDRLRVDTDINAYVTEVGWRGRSVLVLGLPLWDALSAQGKVALLGHELGHLAHRDLRRGGVVFQATMVLRRAVGLLLPGFLDLHAYRGRRAVFYQLVNGIRRLLGQPFLAVLFVLDRLDLRAGQRAELGADVLSIRLAGRDGAVDLTQTLLGRQGLVTRLQAAVQRREDPWEVLRARVVVPEREIRRRVRADELTGVGADDTHPPTHLRRELALRLGEGRPELVLADDELARTDEELAAARRALRSDLEGFLLQMR